MRLSWLILPSEVFRFVSLFPLGGCVSCLIFPLWNAWFLSPSPSPRDMFVSCLFHLSLWRCLYPVLINFPSVDACFQSLSSLPREMPISCFFPFPLGRCLFPVSSFPREMPVSCLFHFSLGRCLSCLFHLSVDACSLSLSSFLWEVPISCLDHLSLGKRSNSQDDWNRTSRDLVTIDDSFCAKPSAWRPACDPRGSSVFL